MDLTVIEGNLCGGCRLQENRKVNGCSKITQRAPKTSTGCTLCSPHSFCTPPNTHLTPEPALKPLPKPTRSATQKFNSPAHSYAVLPTLPHSYSAAALLVRQWQLTRWSSTIPVACMYAYMIVGPCRQGVENQKVSVTPNSTPACAVEQGQVLVCFVSRHACAVSFKCGETHHKLHARLLQCLAEGLRLWGPVGCVESMNRRADDKKPCMHRAVSAWARSIQLTSFVHLHHSHC